MRPIFRFPSDWYDATVTEEVAATRLYAFANSQMSKRHSDVGLGPRIPSNDNRLLEPWTYSVTPGWAHGWVIIKTIPCLM